MTVAQKEEQSTKNLNIEDTISKAIHKLGVKKENELCKYLPMKTGGYMHHFTFRKMKTKLPQELASIIERHVMHADKPLAVAPKQRAARGSRKRRDHMNFTRNQLERMLNIARLAGDKEIISILSPRKSLSTCKRELIQSIRQSRLDHDLWNAYAEAINAQQMMSEMAATHQI